jgi:DNA-binding response OmpR family regulator
MLSTIQATDEAESVAVSTRASRIVLASGESDLRGKVAAALRTHGHAVLVVHDGIELVAYLVTLYVLDEFPDLIVCDTRMPGGVEILESLREIEPTPTPVIVITTAGEKKLEIEGRLDSVEVFEDPFDMDDFLTTVRGILGAGEP